jgi:dTMP kinase
MSMTDIAERRQPRMPVTSTDLRRTDGDSSVVTVSDLANVAFAAAVYERRATCLPSTAVARKRGLFITFEGIEGSGKSTQIARAAALLERLGVSHLATREPGGTPLGKELRRHILDVPGPLDPSVELLLLFADRKQHLVTGIEPALLRGEVVLCDRYTDASRAYQGGGRRLGEETVDALHERFCRREPDRTFLFDCPVPVALARLRKRAKAIDRIDGESLAFHRRVRAAYLSRAEREPARFSVLDAARSEDDVFAALSQDLLAYLETKRGRA